MSARILWRRSEEGYVDSHCGRFHIYPLYMGTTTAQGYELHDEKLGRRSSADTQRDCKVEAEEIIKREST